MKRTKDTESERLNTRASQCIQADCTQILRENLLVSRCDAVAGLAAGGDWAAEREGWVPHKAEGQGEIVSFVVMVGHAAQVENDDRPRDD